jgi:predicted ATPase
MITRVYARNYRSIGEIDLDLGALTALVGPNASGKSNIADVLRFLSDCVGSSLRRAVAIRQGFGALRRWSGELPLDMDVGILVEDKRGSGFWAFTLAAGDTEDTFRIQREVAGWYDTSWPAEDVRSHLVELLARRAHDKPSRFDEARIQKVEQVHGFERIDGAFWSPDNLAEDPHSNTTLVLPNHLAVYLRVLEPLVEAVSSLAVYSLFPDGLRAPQNPDPSKPMLTRGNNWASTLKALDKESGGSELLAALGRIVGDIDDYRVVQAGGFLIPEIRHGLDASGHERWLGAAQESDGTLRVAAILTALFQEPAPSLLGFEEPELAVHPGAIPVLFDFLKEASTRSQILLTTHSPDLLDLLSIDDVRVVERRDGATTVARVEERQRELVHKRLMSASDLLHAEGLRPEGAGGDG